MIQDRSILVTGGAGFIGSHLIDRLIDSNRITVFDNFSSGKREFIEGHLNRSNFALIEGDLLNPNAIEAALDEIDLVFHLAANPDVKIGAEETKTHLHQNVVATYNLLDAMRKKGVGEIAFTSTSTVYGEAGIIPTPEGYGPLLPISLYGASKLASEALICAFCGTFDMRSWIFRFANIVGERGTHGVIVDFINKLKEDSAELEILGSGRQRKSYLLVDDCVDGMIFAVGSASHLVNVFNIGSKDSMDVTEIADVVVEKMGLSGVRYRYTGGVDGRGWRGDVKTMLLSTEAMETLGWRPGHTSRESVEAAAASLLRRL
ncbi:NAD-dependent epimerase/dehydratase family protein [Methanotrichaceae archaeon Mx]|uniref:NAD-dependent epimerase/dehydratase family protein n=1 Tax=Candidatus Methanocrinis natronophilus TaxID=3033396 RepID=A0ABT5X6A8_9EURY|nr:NAD-dependent epimerase/dehydratase family protein [Candidatus Methanocrinis natronophilus]MDF0590188.1 NAD-dependent epimerase/dehydratase family protein [Candidatus Methanocrinis natronophilus]